jgi:predicted acyltransferase (DUF342 family)
MTAGLSTYATFALVCLLLLVLPFVPALREWRYPTDFAALPVLPNYSSDIDHFARRFLSDATAKLGLGAPTGYEDFDFVTLPLDGMAWAKARKRLISRTAIKTWGPVRSVQPLYVEGDLQTGAESVYPALYATGDIDLGAGSEIHDWAHADGALRMGRNSMALRRVSAGVAIELDNEVWFERLQAPVLRFGSRADIPAARPASATQVVALLSELPGAILQSPLLVMVRGDCALEAGKLYSGSLVVTGFLTIGAGTTVVGDVKAREGLSIGPGASVQGAVICDKRIYMFKHATALGPVASESDILIGRGAVVGLPGSPTTVSARNIVIEEGVVAHGALWAHDIGMVKQT